MGISSRIVPQIDCCFASNIPGTRNHGKQVDGARGSNIS